MPMASRHLRRPRRAASEPWWAALSRYRLFLVVLLSAALPSCEAASFEQWRQLAIEDNVTEDNVTVLRNDLERLQSGFRELEEAFKERTETIEANQSAMDTAWVLYNTSLVMFMQLGFALVESGSVRKKSFRHVFLKNIMDFSVGMTLWFVVGYWIAFPEIYPGDIFNSERFDLFWQAEEARGFAFQMVFASTSVTIVSGSMAERTRIEAYLAFVALMGGMIYSVVVRWSWGGGWMNDLEPPYHDFAGSGVIHCTGGVAALVGCWLVGPRTGRFQAHEDDAIKEKFPDRGDFTPHSLDNIVTGTLILWFGWLGFNPGSSGGISGEGADTAGVAYVNTLVAPPVAALVVVIGCVAEHHWKRKSRDRPPMFDMGQITNGILGGLVAITAGCDSIPPEWAVWGTGPIAGTIVYLGHKLLIVLRIDDPVDAVVVHGMCGMFGVISVGLWDVNAGLITTGESALLVTQLWAAGAIVLYVGGTAFVYFYLVAAYGLLRVDLVSEAVGADLEHFNEGDSVDTTYLEVHVNKEEMRKMLSCMAGPVWGISREEAMQYAYLHRRLTSLFLTIAILWNFFYYTVLEWRGWAFYAVVIIAIGTQSAAASHAEFKLPTDHPQIKWCCIVVVVIGVGLSVCNYVLASGEDATANLQTAFAKTMTLSLGWSFWMHLRVHPMKWDDLCYCIAIRESRWPYFRALLGISRVTTCLQCLAGIVLVGRMQHIVESSLSFASLTSDLWVGLDELKTDAPILGITVICFSSLQLTGVLSKLVVASGLRNVRFFAIVTSITWMSEAPIAAIVFIRSQSSLKYISLSISMVSMANQLFVTVIAFLWQRRKSQNMTPNVQPMAEAVPLTLLEPTMRMQLVNSTGRRNSGIFGRLFSGHKSASITSRGSHSGMRKSANDADHPSEDITSFVRDRYEDGYCTEIAHDTIFEHSSSYIIAEEGGFAEMPRRLSQRRP
mmetsp:Transcript_9533/g.21214  ORF Transcript_9533/g.21214 Transcript_9533/m.21214 type:complete len:951 (-) Transcript_9533:257-3109(-)